MRQSTWDKLDEQFSEFPFMKAGSVPAEELLKAERDLGVKFSQDYKEFVEKYGGAIVGPYPIYGVRHAEPMDDFLWSVVDVTLRYRNEGWPETESLYVISSDHSDNPVGITEDGHVITYDHDLGKKMVLADSFEDYLLQCLS